MTQLSLFKPRREIRDMVHRCHVEGCRVAVPPRLLMCRRHWKKVPRDLQREIWANFNPAQCAADPAKRVRPSEGWLEAARRALRFVEESERVPPPAG